MKNTKKLLALALVFVLAVFCMAGCGEKGNKDEANQKVVVGTNAEFPPFEFVDSENGVINEFAGIDMEIIKFAGEKCGKEIEINNMDFDGILVALEKGKIDAAISGITITDDRKKHVDFTEPYYIATQVMIVSKDSDIKSAKDIADKKIGVIDGYTGQTCIEEMGYDFSGYRKGADAVLDLSNGKLDVVVIDSATAESFVGDNKDLMIVEDKEAFAEEQYGIAVQKGNKELVEQFNKAIKELKENGELDKICKKYM